MLYFRTLWAIFFKRSDLPTKPYVVTTQGNIFRFVCINQYAQNYTVETGHFSKGNWIPKEQINLSPTSIKKYISESSAKKAYAQRLKQRNQDLMNQTLDLD